MVRSGTKACNIASEAEHRCSERPRQGKEAEHWTDRDMKRLFVEMVIAMALEMEETRSRLLECQYVCTQPQMVT